MARAGVDLRPRVGPREYIQDGDKVVVTGVFRVSPKGTGRSAEVPFAHVWTVQDGRLAGMRGCTDVREIYALSRELRAAA